jgi:hypothetical protein
MHAHLAKHGWLGVRVRGVARRSGVLVIGCSQASYGDELGINKGLILINAPRKGSSRRY